MIDVSAKEVEEIRAKSRDYVKIGKVIVTEHPSDYNLLGIGSCIIIFMYDLDRKIYSMAHCLLPEYSSDYKNPDGNLNKYADKAVHYMYRELIKRGADKNSIKVKLVGGARIYNDLAGIGEKNVEVARREVRRLNLQIVAEDVGGKDARSVMSFNEDGTIVIKKGTKFYKL